MTGSLIVSLSLALTSFTAASAVTESDTLTPIQHEWATCQYQSKDQDNQELCFNNLIKRTENALQKQPDSNELKIWLAINKASLAGAKGGLGALSLAKEAKALLEQVIDVAPETLHGSAYTSLGSLYYKVPGWPIGFGDDDTAEEMLRQALTMNPDGIDPNYFYGDFLAEDGRKQEAVRYLSRALNAAPRVGRPLADQGRRKEIKMRLESLK
jgi:tetratricopeptide (TPR) repeat protein